MEEVVGADPVSFATHLITRTKVTLTYRQTRNLRAYQLSLGHKKIENNLRYRGLDLDDTLEISRYIDISGLRFSAVGTYLAHYTNKRPDT